MTVLREEYNIETEMAAGSYVIAMTGAGDTRESVERLAEALEEIDAGWTGGVNTVLKYNTGNCAAEKPAFTAGTSLSRDTAFSRSSAHPEAVSVPAAAFHSSCEPVPLRAAAGRIAHDIVTVYPPGIPLTVPGEKVTDSIIQAIVHAINDRLHVTGMTEKDGEPAVPVIRD